MPVCTEHEIELWPAGLRRLSACLRVLPEFADGQPEPDLAVAAAEFVTERNPDG